MSSIWNWLCFPRNRFVAGKTHNSKRQRRRNKNNVVTLQKRKLLDDAGHFQEVHSIADRGTTTQNVTNNTVPNKRRRIQDIFNQEPHHSVPYSDNETTVSDTGAQNDSFTHMKVPSLFYQREKNQRPTSDNVESMYGYVPKAMQSMYTSTALEGQKIEDYFSNLHNDIYFSKFANSDAETKDKTGNVLQILPFNRVPSSASVKEDKTSLIEEDTSEDEMDIGTLSNFKQWQNQTTPRTDPNMEAKFHSMLNSVEEVLY